MNLSCIQFVRRGKYIYIYIYIYVGLVGRVFANGLDDRIPIPDQVIPKAQKIFLDASLLSTQHYEVRIKGKQEEIRERSCALPYSSVKNLLKRVPLSHLWQQSSIIYIYIYIYIYIVIAFRMSVLNREVRQLTKMASLSFLHPVHSQSHKIYQQNAAILSTRWEMSTGENPPKYVYYAWNIYTREKNEINHH